MDGSVAGEVHSRHSERFGSPGEAARAIDALVARGVEPSRISVWLPDCARDERWALRKTSRGAEWAGKGAVVGGLSGGVVAYVAATERVWLPWISPLLAGVTPWLAVLAGVGALGALLVVVVGLAGLCRSEYRARRVVREASERSNIIVTVDAPTLGG